MLSSCKHTPACTCARVRVCAELCPTLCDPRDCSPPGSSVCGILQARILEWAAASFSRGSSRPGDRTLISCLSHTFRQILYTAQRGRPKHALTLLRTPTVGAWPSAPRARAPLKVPRGHSPPLVSGLGLTRGWGELFSVCEAAYTGTFQRGFQLVKRGRREGNVSWEGEELSDNREGF